MQLQAFAGVARRHRDSMILPTILILLILVLLSACGSQATQTGSPPGATTASGGLPPIDPNNPQSALAALTQRVYSVGPHGETATPASQVQLSVQELQQIKGMNPTAAIVLHYAGNDWSQAQVAGLKYEFGLMGIKVIAVTDANFNANTQVSDIQTVLTKKPSIIVSIPVDPVATASAYRKAVDQGVKLVFMDNVPQGFVAGKDYVSVVSADNYGNGAAAALLMAEKLHGKGKIGLIYYNADFFVTNQRYTAFQATIAHFPGIQVVSEKGIPGPDFAGQAETAASAMLTQFPDLSGIWGVWDVPSEGILAAARSAGDPNLVITTCDLGLNVADAIKKGQFIYGLGAQRPFDQGIAEAMLAGYGLLGKTAPSYVALNALPVTAANVLQAWQTVYHAAPPASLAGA